jgi:predicted DNA-binding transcriptional regulator AlpA
MEREFLFAEEVEALIGLDRSTLWRNERAGLFPRRFVIGRRRVAWDKREIEAYIADRMAARTTPPAPGRQRRRRERA